MNMTELTRVFDHCAAHPDQHDQTCWFGYDNYANVWADGITHEDGPVLTADWQQHIVACVAGWAAILNGWRPVHPNSLQVVNDAGAVASVVTVAREHLGLDADQATIMFSQFDTLEEIRQVAEKAA